MTLITTQQVTKVAEQQSVESAVKALASYSVQAVTKKASRSWPRPWS